MPEADLLSLARLALMLSVTIGCTKSFVMQMSHQNPYLSMPGFGKSPKHPLPVYPGGAYPQSPNPG